MTPEMSLTDAEQVIANAARIFEALNRVKSIVTDAAGLERGIIERQRIVAGLNAEIARLRTEALDLAQRAVQEAETHRATVERDAATLDTLRREIGQARDEHAALMKTQEKDAADERGRLRREHAALVAQQEAVTERLRQEHDVLAAGLLKLQQQIKPVPV